VRRGPCFSEAVVSSVVPTIPQFRDFEFTSLRQYCILHLCCVLRETSSLPPIMDEYWQGRGMCRKRANYFQMNRVGGETRTNYSLLESATY